MPNVPTSTPEQFYQGAPLLLVPDVPTTAAFYRRILGFKTDPGTATPEYTVVWRDNAAVHLAKGEDAPTGVRIFFWVKDVNALYEEVLNQGAAIASEPVVATITSSNFTYLVADSSTLTVPAGAATSGTTPCTTSPQASASFGPRTLELHTIATSPHRPGCFRTPHRSAHGHRIDPQPVAWDPRDHRQLHGGCARCRCATPAGGPSQSRIRVPGRG